VLPAPGAPVGDQFPAVSQAVLLFPVQSEYASNGVAIAATTSKKVNALKASFNAIRLWKPTKIAISLFMGGISTKKGVPSYNKRI
jgi:hypothetical protein